MKLMDAIKDKHGKLEIMECSRFDLPEFFVELGYKVGVEIGVYKGKFSRHLCKSGIEIYSIDPWSIYDDFNEVAMQYPWRPRRHVDQAHLDYLFSMASWRLNRFSNSHIVRKTSMEAAKDFDNESIDFVYIDGNHFIKYVAEDIWEWTKKVKKGGIVAGHDYLTREDCPCQVKEVVDIYARVFGIEDWYIIGPESAKTWMWFKK